MPHRKQGILQGQIIQLPGISFSCRPELLSLISLSCSYVRPGAVTYGCLDFLWAVQKAVVPQTFISALKATATTDVWLVNTA